MTMYSIGDRVKLDNTAYNRINGLTGTVIAKIYGITTPQYRVLLSTGERTLVHPVFMTPLEAAESPLRPELSNWDDVYRVCGWNPVEA